LEAARDGVFFFTYLEHDDVPPDNNAAERPLRHFVAQRKASGNFVSPEVMDVYAVLLYLSKIYQFNDVSLDAVLPLLIAGTWIRCFKKSCPVSGTHDLGISDKYPRLPKFEINGQLQPPGLS
jgi:hypothetical protein